MYLNFTLRLINSICWFGKWVSLLENPLGCKLFALTAEGGLVGTSDTKLTTSIVIHQIHLLLLSLGPMTSSVYGLSSHKIHASMNLVQACGWCCNSSEMFLGLLCSWADVMEM